MLITPSVNEKGHTLVFNTTKFISELLFKYRKETKKTNSIVVV